jgi:putative Mg2+ transporter-C (MgtC) family protein
MLAMKILLEELTGGFANGAELERAVIRLIAAMLLGALIGVQREFAGKPAGLRTHMLVAMGSALFVLGASAAAMSLEGLSRVIQGVATGLGFIGAGAILKHRDERQVEGLTTAAGIWMTAAAGVAAGLGRIGLAALGAILTLAILAFAGFLESRIAKARGASHHHGKSPEAESFSDK